CWGEGVGRSKRIAELAAADVALLRAEVQVRYKHAPAHATIVPASDGSARVAFDAPVRAVSPGQAAVFYQGDELIGGGWLEETLP
ncbi:MAG: aminomethyltransferase beta-barrel domain-containing protein, partial [Myxococcota bacterium]